MGRWAADAASHEARRADRDPHRLWTKRHTSVTSFGEQTRPDTPRPLRPASRTRPILVGFWMPQDAQGETPRRVFECFQRSVGRAGCFLQARPQRAEALVVVRLHILAVAEDRRQPRSADDRDVVLRE